MSIVCSSDLVITGDVKGWGLDLVRRYAARLAAEKPLRRPTLERYLSLIRDIPGLETEVQLLNLQTAGAVRLVLTLKHDDLDFGLVVNNRGIANLGRTQVPANATAKRSEERRVGKECVSTCRSRWSPSP